MNFNDRLQLVLCALIEKLDNRQDQLEQDNLIMLIDNIEEMILN